ncbi:citrate lyase subunit alpha|uniref:Citrate lyase alpha chain n=1 Tax=Dendrosporobacter quercicolus TaxID=146817 RepID=A0A1G9SVD3_9FIRM|nr:citrate lyase subunit alpha [Dendrosporobacter quercicolus]NSL48603.1 citrate lyase subunit alpha [Dendrosporobacter quercicolus DSM 1736]SDM39428.1 citrate lyase subunit alpha / citrate CoA-transferase [Dendrosporobacter quercicolus]
MINAAGREIPESIPGLKKVVPYAGPFTLIPQNRMAGPRLSVNLPKSDKLLTSIDQALDAVGLKDGMTISFHHHFRNGDYLLNSVVEAIARRKLKGITLAPSSLTDVNQAIIPFIEAGVITAIETSGARGALGRLITDGRLARPVIIRSHGGRARAIECDDLHIDVAFIGAPCCDCYGNINGTEGKSACGSLGYAMVDAAYADKVVAITDNLAPHPIFPVSIPQTQVDYIVEVASIGDPKGIASGALRISKDPRELLIAEFAARVIEYSGYFRDGYSLQLGSGGAALATAKFIREKMLARSITASFGVGGVTAPFVGMLEEGLIKTVFDTQDFDIVSIESLKKNPNHLEISASYYANPHSRGPIVNNLDFVILSATEIDVNFNVNVITDSNGVLMGASGGHCDTAAGAAVSIVVAPLLRGRLPMVRDRVHTIITPGETVDVVVTERGIAVNPQRRDLLDCLKSAKLPLMSIEELQKIAYDLAGKPEPVEVTDEIVAVVEYRDGSVLDVIRKPR